jgi:hypothetical protein
MPATQPGPQAPGQQPLSQQPQPVVVMQRPAAAPQSASPAGPLADPEAHPRDQVQEPHEVLIYSHSTFFYWWPVWLTGYLMALTTWMSGETVQVGDHVVYMSHNKNLGVVFTFTFFLVILITTVTLRGLASVVAILAAAFTVLFMAYFDLWAPVMRWLGMVSIYMNMGFFLFFSTLVFLVWAGSVFVYDRLSYWKVRPGQITYEQVIGGAQKSYDTRGMVFEKHRNDLFRHWVLGMGSGDIQISTTGAKRESLYVPNVLFVNTKIDQIQRLIAMQPDQFTAPAT